LASADLTEIVAAGTTEGHETTGTQGGL
jgi:hypothetical protein